MTINAGRFSRGPHQGAMVSMARALVSVMALPLIASAQFAAPAVAFAPLDDLTALETAAETVFVPPTANSVAATTVQAGFRNWFSFLGNRSTSTVTNPTVSVMSGYDPALFDSITAFPSTSTAPSLAPGQSYPAGNLWPRFTLPDNMIAVDYSLGYDSSRAVSPSLIPAGGSQQTVTITLTPADLRYATTADGFVGFDVILNSNVPGVTVASTTNPSNLDQGEQLQVPTNPLGLFQWQLLGAPQLNKQYTFTAVLNVPNASGVSFAFLPTVQIGGGRQTVVCDSCSGRAVTVTDPTLDGNIPDSGAVTFSVADDGHTWAALRSDYFVVSYQGSLPAVNHPPTADDKSISTPQDTPAAVTLTGTDPDSNPVTFAVVTGPAHGTLSGPAPNLTYTPTAEYTGPDSFTYKANDGQADSAPATVSIVVTPVASGCAATAPTVDVTVSADQKTAASKLVSGKVTATGSNELVLAFIQADGPTAPTQMVTGVNGGGGLTWTLAARSNSTWGTTEVWQAYATTPLTNAVVTAKLANAFDGSITVTAFTGAAKKVGATATGAGTTGQPTAKLAPVGCNSLVWASGHDWTHNTPAVAGTGQTIVHQFIDKRVHDSFWTQKVDTPTTLGTDVTVKDTNPTKDRWTLAAVEIPPAD